MEISQAEYDHLRGGRRPTGLLKVLACLCLMGLAGIGVYRYAPQLLARLVPDPIILIATPTAGAFPRSTPLPRQPISDPVSAPVQQGIDAYNATATAQYNAAIGAPAPVPNTDTTGDSAPVSLESKPAERQPAGDNVPTAEPIAPAESNDQHGSKPVLVNPQETHQCLNGQHWTENGCKNP